MSEHDTFDDDLDGFDGHALEALLDGSLADAGPETFLPLVPLVAAARRPPSGAELAGEAQALALYRRSRRRAVTPSDARRSRRLGVRLVVIAGAVTVASATGAAAATGGLPGPVQDTAAALLSTVGISVPDGGGVPGGPPVPPASPTTAAAESSAAPADSSSATSATVADATIEADATLGPDVAPEEGATVAAVPAPAGPGSGSSRPGDDAKPGKGAGDKADAPPPGQAKDPGQGDGPGEDAGPGQDDGNRPPGQAGKDHEPGVGATKAKPAPDPPKPPKDKAAPPVHP